MRPKTYFFPFFRNHLPFRVSLCIAPLRLLSVRDMPHNSDLRLCSRRGHSNRPRDGMPRLGKTSSAVRVRNALAARLEQTWEVPTETAARP